MRPNRASLLHSVPRTNLGTKNKVANFSVSVSAASNARIHFRTFSEKLNIFSRFLGLKINSYLILVRDFLIWLRKKWKKFQKMRMRPLRPLFLRKILLENHTRDFSISSKLLLTLLIYFWNEFKEKKGDFLLSFAV